MAPDEIATIRADYDAACDVLARDTLDHTQALLLAKHLHALLAFAEKGLERTRGVDLGPIFRLLKEISPWPWRWWTSNSLNRLSSDPSGKDGDVAHAYRTHDGYDNIDIRQRDMAFIEMAPKLVDDLCNAVAWYRRREAALVEALGGVAEEGRYRNDIIDKIRLVIGQRDAALAKLARLEATSHPLGEP